MSALDLNLKRPVRQPVVDVQYLGSDVLALVYVRAQQKQEVKNTADAQRKHRSSNSLG